MIILLLFLLVIYLLWLEDEIKLTKSELADDYGISKKTLANWVQHFGPPDLAASWDNSGRKVSFYNYLRLSLCFGERPDDRVWNKAVIVEECDSSYKVLRGMLLANFERLGWNREAVDLRVYPPSVAEGICAIMEGEEKI